MALIYNARLVPSKIELMTPWVAVQPWRGDADGSSLDVIGAYRFDDPQGAVGIETHLVMTGGRRILQVPLTYRGAPLAGADASLVGTLDHSVLGRRWVYDGCADPVYVNALLAAILTGGRQADLDVESDGRRERREPATEVIGSGTSDVAPAPVDAVRSSNTATTTIVNAGDFELVVLRVLDDDTGYRAGGQILSGVLSGRSEPTTLATLPAST